MTDRFRVATHKGVFTFVRDGGSWKQEQVAFLGENATIVMRDPRDGAVYAALALGHFGVKLHRSDDGETFTEVAVPRYPEGAELKQHPEMNPGAPPKPASLSEIWALAAGGPDREGRLWAGTIPGGLFVSDDRGDSWQLVEALWNRQERDMWFGGGKDDPGIHSVLVDPRNSDRVLCGVSCAGVWITENAGASWRQGAHGMIAEFMPPGQQENPDIQDPHLIALCRDAPDHVWCQHHNGIFRSTDGSTSWSPVENAAPSGFGFAVAVHPADPNTAWFVPGVKDECRVPVDGRLVVTRTRDGGETFESLSNGLPTGDAYDIVFRHALDVDATGNRLVMGTTTGNLWTTDDAGDTWQHVTAHLPPVHCVRFDP